MSSEDEDSAAAAVQDWHYFAGTMVELVQHSISEVSQRTDLSYGAALAANTAMARGDMAGVKRMVEEEEVVLADWMERREVIMQAWWTRLVTIGNSVIPGYGEWMRRQGYEVPQEPVV